VYHFRDDVYEFFAGRPSTKLLLLEEPGRVQELQPIWHERLGDQLYVTISDPEYLEFMSREATKGWALLRLCEHFGIDPSETAAFGDAPNDLPLIQAAGLGVAMANAREAVREAADLIAPSNEEDGVAQVIEGWLDGVVQRP
jgi:hydroxymethylpyrimidine pyrophosphatase-like HAD family hydrolase